VQLCVVGFAKPIYDQIQINLLNSRNLYKGLLTKLINDKLAEEQKKYIMYNMCSLLVHKKIKPKQLGEA